MAIRVHYQDQAHRFHTACTFSAIPEDARLVWVDFENPTQNDQAILTQRFNIAKHHIEASEFTVTRPKISTHPHKQHLYLILHAISHNDFSAEPLSITVKHNWMITVHKYPMKVLSDIISSFNTLPKEITVTELVAVMIDRFTEEYFNYVNRVEDIVFSFENQNVDKVNNRKLMDDVYRIRSEIIKLKRILIPMEQLLNEMIDETSLNVSHEYQLLIKHIHSRLLRQNDTLMACEHITDDIKDNNESYHSNRINGVMNVLTIISSIFFPLSFLTGWYGMNFSYMPELDWHYSYFVFIAISFIVVVSLITLFKKKDWF
ncbi:magnesium transporter [Staphylococcus borealis]|uniref:Magnesium transporter CorA n=1 Tax=Staphylococcus borealis TaxID=2742203 RepID=A0ABX2LGR9_9STAP|nr:CorA family divalent cation transporter [Staphylococcus borealis]NUI81503.1 magnesium transporter CorA [Staphylococcus borealis]NUI90918.1 magnesium transporter CorA [Staphylococcus borealis]